MADALAVMDLGRIVQFGPAHELYNRPADVFVARLLGPTNLLQGQVDSQSGDWPGRDDRPDAAGPPDRPEHVPAYRDRECPPRSRSGPRP